MPEIRLLTVCLLCFFIIFCTVQNGGGGLLQQMKKSYSLSDLSESVPAHDEQAMIDEADDVMCDPRIVRRAISTRSYPARRCASESNSGAPLYFSELDVDVVRGSRVVAQQDFSYVKSSEDISSGYSSADNSGAKEQLLTRTGSIGANRVPTRTGGRTGLTTVRRPQAAEDSEVTIEEVGDYEKFHEYPTLLPSSPYPHPYHISQTEPPFLFEIVDNKIKIVRLLDRNTNLVNIQPVIRENEQCLEENTVFEDAQDDIQEKPVESTNAGIEAEMQINLEVETIINKTIQEGNVTYKNDDFIIPYDKETKDIATNVNMHLNKTNKDHFNVIPVVVDVTVSEDKFMQRDSQKSETQISVVSLINTETCVNFEAKDKSVIFNFSCSGLDSIQPSLDASKDMGNDDLMESHVQKLDTSILDASLFNKETCVIDETKDKSVISNSPSSTSLNSTQPSLDICKDMKDAISNADTSSVNIRSEDSDDGAFATPDSSPKIAKKKVKGGKYGKCQAPSPPTSSDREENGNNDSINKKKDRSEKGSTEKIDLITEKESVILNLQKEKRVSPIKATLVLKPGIVKEIGPNESSTGKPTKIFISETNKRKRRIKMKTKSAHRNKHESPITILKQLPGKLAFWHRADKSKTETDTDSSSDGYSIMSSDYEDVYEKRDVEIINNYETSESCVNIRSLVIIDEKDPQQIAGVANEVLEEASPKIEPGPSEVQMDCNSSQIEDNEILNDVKNILEKGDALQKLVEAKIVDHPEYKYIPLHGTEDKLYKSTDV